MGGFSKPNKNYYGNLAPAPVLDGGLLNASQSLAASKALQAALGKDSEESVASSAAIAASSLAVSSASYELSEFIAQHSGLASYTNN